MHKVRVDTEHLRELKWEEEGTEELVRKSFEFLLERESNQSILREFNLRDISRYFPEFKEKIKSSS